jgi:hypothetical protein
MKFIVFVFMLFSFASYSATEKRPEKVDISVKNIIERSCAISGYFNQLACEDEVLNCYNDHGWPKTVSIKIKVDVVIRCSYYIIRR